jgi:hypothetical protein
MRRLGRGRVGLDVVGDLEAGHETVIEHIKGASALRRS